MTIDFSAIVPVILSGGSGTRLWPMSRELYPKQLLSLTGTGNTMLQDTISRLSNLKISSPIVVCNEQHRFMVAEQLLQIGIENPSIILEPEGRNTAPAIAISALEIIEKHNDAMMLVLPADHQITNIEAFNAAVERGMQFAAEDNLVTFGIVPTEPHTGFGYIQAAEEKGTGGYCVNQFVEKPDYETAQSYLDRGNYYWNSGMFLFKASVYLQELEKNNPDMVAACKKAYQGRNSDRDFVRLDKEAFLSSPSDSVDYAVMEKTINAVVVPMDAGWSDVGSWSALWDIAKKDNYGNVALGDIHVDDVKNSYLHADSRFVAVVGVDNVVVIETADAVLVVSKDRVQDVKSIVSHLKNNKREEHLLHRRVIRPWGSYECIDEEDRFKVKRIMVKPGASLSLQMHNHRAEHWVVVKGTARVTKNEDVFMLSENESTFIPIGMNHRLENTGKIPLEIVEVQSGSYLGEDDIVRFDDVYGRKS